MLRRKTKRISKAELEASHAELQGQFNEQSGQIETLRAKLADMGQKLDAGVAAQAEDAAKLRQRDEKLAAELQQRDEKLAALKRQHKQLETKHQSLRASQEEHRSANEDLRRQNASLRIENIRLREEIASIRSSAMFEAALVFEKGLRPGRDTLLVVPRLIGIAWRWLRHRLHVRRSRRSPSSREIAV